MNRKFVNIAFNLPIDSLFTYSIPKDLIELIKPGSRVLAPFGKRNITGVAINFCDTTGLKSVKSVIKLLDSEPIMSQEMIDFCKWISTYYFSPIGEVVFSAVPKGITVESKFLYSLNPEIN